MISCKTLQKFPLQYFPTFLKTCQTFLNVLQFLASFLNLARILQNLVNLFRFLNYFWYCQILAKLALMSNLWVFYCSCALQFGLHVILMGFWVQFSIWWNFGNKLCCFLFQIDRIWTIWRQQTPRYANRRQMAPTG